MSAVLVVTLIIVGIVVMVAAAVIAQSLENARKERKLKIGVINERIRHLSGTLNDIPNNYMTADLRQFVISLLRQNCSAILALEPHHSSAKTQRQQLEALSSQPFTNELDSLQPPFDDPLSGQKIRARIKDLVNIIVAMNKDGSLEKAQAVKYVNQGKMMFELISVDIALIGARNSEKNDSTLKVALINYSSCLKKLQAINTQAQFTHRISHIQAKSQQLQEKIKLQTEQAAALVAAAASEPGEQNAAEDWKIKQDYE